MKDLTKLGYLVVNAFFWGIGILIGYTVLEMIFDKFDGLENIIIRIIFLTIVGGVYQCLFINLLIKKHNESF